MDFFSGLRVPQPPSVHAAPEERQVSTAAPNVARESVRSAGLPLRLGVRATQALLLQRLHLRLPGVRPAATRSAAAAPGFSRLQKCHGCECASPLRPQSISRDGFFISLQFLSISPVSPHKSVSPSIQHTAPHQFWPVFFFFLIQCWTGWCSLNLVGWVVTAGC